MLSLHYQMTDSFLNIFKVTEKFILAVLFKRQFQTVVPIKSPFAVVYVT